MGLADTDPEVVGAQLVGEAFGGAPVVIGSVDPSGNVATTRVDSAGRVLSSPAEVLVPEGATPFSLYVPVADLDVNSTTDTDSLAIPDGQTLYIQCLVIGSEGDGRGSLVELIWLENTTEKLITRRIINGTHRPFAFNNLSNARDGTDLTGALGNRKLRIRRSRLSSGRRIVDAEVHGYFQ